MLSKEIIAIFTHIQRLLGLDMKTKVVLHVPKIIFHVFRVFKSFQVFKKLARGYVFIALSDFHLEGNAYAI